MEDNILEIKNLSKKYKRFTLDSINMELPQGYIMGLIGENGAGKTTIIKLIMNLVNKDSGSIKVFGMDNVKFEREVKDRIGFVYDAFYGFDYLTLEQNSRLIGQMYSKWDEVKLEHYFSKYGLNKKQKLRELSKGMRMKYSLCLALCHDADLLILDEPTSGLDPVVRAEVLEELQSVVEDEKKGVIISTHITTDLDKIADYITFIKNGSVVFSTAKDEVDDKYYIVKGENSDVDSNKEELFLGISRNKFGFEALTDNIDRVKENIDGSLVIEKASIEDIMLLYK